MMTLRPQCILQLFQADFIDIIVVLTSRRWQRLCVID